MRNFSDNNSRENQNTFYNEHIFFPKILPFMSNVEKYSRAGEATDDNMAHAHFAPLT
jgi:hypothetical protein